MAIIYNKEKRIFSLHTEHTTYQMMADTHDYLLHLYYRCVSWVRRRNSYEKIAETDQKRI